MPSRAPESTSWRLTHSWRVRGTQPILGEIDSMAANSDGYAAGHPARETKRLRYAKVSFRRREQSHRPTPVADPNDRSVSVSVSVTASGYRLDSLSVDERPASAKVFGYLLTGCQERRVHLLKGYVVEPLHGAGQRERSYELFSWTKHGTCDSRASRIPLSKRNLECRGPAFGHIACECSVQNFACGPPVYRQKITCTNAIKRRDSPRCCPSQP